MDIVVIKRSLTNNPNVATLWILAFVVLLYLDFYMSSITDVAVNFIQSPLGFALFFIILGSTIVASLLIINRVFAIVREKSSFEKFARSLRIVQIVIYALLTLLLLDMLVDRQYFTITLTSIMIVSYGSSILMSIFISFKLFTWFKDNKNKFAFIFGLSIFFLFVNNVVSILLFATLLSEKSAEISLTTPVVFNFECDIDSFYCSFKENIINIQSYTLMIYFSLFWISNYFLLHYHIKKIGRLRFFALIAIPLVLFFFVFIYHYDELYSLSEITNFDESVIFMLQIFIVTFSISLCGVLYGVGFKSVANLLKISSHVERYLKMASVGIVLLFISANATIVGASLPPYGIPSISFIPFASLLFYIGIYYSIISISNDIKVRKYIKSSAYKELEIMGELAQSQMMENMKERVLKMTKKYSHELHQSNNSETMESEEDLRSYLDEAINVFNRRGQNNPS